MAYADGDDLVARYDIDLVGDLATDDRESLDRDDIPTHPHVLVALDDASGEIDAALKAGGRYTAAQLAGLTGNDLAFLKRIVCGLAIAAMHERRPEALDSATVERLTKRALDAITELRGGKNVFGLEEHFEAGLPDTGGPTALDLETRNDLSTRMGRFFPSPDSRLPRGR